MCINVSPSADEIRLITVDERYATDIGYESPKEYLSPKNVRPAVFGGKHISADLTVQRLWCWEDAEVVAYFVISSGRKDSPTPAGEYVIYQKIKTAISRDFYEEGRRRWWGMPYYLEAGAFGIHGVPSLYMRYDEPIETLGRPASHSCIRLGHVPLENLGGVSPAEWVFVWADLRTPVRVFGEWDFENGKESDELTRRGFSDEAGFYLKASVVQRKGRVNDLEENIKAAGILR
ncbi:MAG: L,D-transpeptidase [Candidatus Coatesbacteria bacterium]|nr:MAG: L,D-transpeptidase [Candidatus Coatesbacteria bacterium]